MTVVEDEMSSNAEVDGSKSMNTALQTSQSGSQTQFSKELRAFYESHNFDLSNGTLSCCCPYRYIRLNPRYDKIETLDMLRSELRNLRENNANATNDTGLSTDEDSTRKSRDVLPVPWLESKWSFYALPENFSLSSSPCFRSGRIYGMDVSSGAGVAVLLSDSYDRTSPSANAISKPDAEKDEKSEDLRILDLCCSPGLKLLQMADFFHNKTKRKVKVVGVDICEHRMNVCKSIVQKYFIDPDTSGRQLIDPKLPEDTNIQLYLQDGTTFGVEEQLSNTADAAPTRQRGNLVFDSDVAMEEMIQRGGKRKRMNKSARARQKKRLREIATTESDLVRKIAADTVESNSENNHDKRNSQHYIGLFDYVLVDAECSTDGSFKHIKERMKESFSDKQIKEVGHKEENTRLTDPGKLAELVELQRKLLASGFRLLKDGGTLVYSTCSLSEDQNEKVVKWLLESYQDAVLVPIHFPSIMDSKFVTEGTVEGTVRFYPNLVQEVNPSSLLLGDGFFVAKIKKRSTIRE